MNIYQRKLLQYSLKELESNNQLAMLLINKVIASTDSHTVLALDSATPEDKDESLEIDKVEEVETVVEEDGDTIEYNPILINKIGTLITILELFFKVFIKQNPLSTEIKKRNKESIQEFRKIKSSLERSFVIMEEAVDKFKNINLTKQESDIIARKINIYKDLLHVSEQSP